MDLLGHGGPPDPAAVAQVAADYGLELDLASVPRLVEQYGLSFGPDASP